MENLLLTQTESNDIFSEVRRLPNQTDNISLLKESSNVLEILKKHESIVDAFERFINNQSPVLSICNLPAVNGYSYVTQLLAVGLTRFIGSPFQYKEQNQRKINAHLSPSPTFLGSDHTGEGDGEFGWHTDDAIFQRDYRCNWIQLFCENNDAKTITEIAALTDIMEQLTETETKILSKNNFVFGIPFSFRTDTFFKSSNRPVLYSETDHQEICYSSYNCHPSCPDDIQSLLALSRLNRIANNVSKQVVLTKGQVVIFNNNLVIHRRGKINGRRSIYRTYIRTSLDALNNIKRSNENLYSFSHLLDESLPGLGQ